MAGRQYLPPLYLFLILLSNGYSIIIRPEPLVFNENSNISVNCEAEQGETNFISLFVDSVDILTLPRYFSTSGVLGNVTYLFGPVNRSDDGSMFECRNDGSSSTSLDVFIPAKFITRPDSSYVGTRGGNVTIDVTYEGDDPVKLSLTKDSGPVRASVITQSGVVFTNLSCSDAGMYTLRISNSGSDATEMFELNVNGTAASVRDTSCVRFDSETPGQARVSLNTIVDVCPPESVSMIACPGQGITVSVDVAEGKSQVMLRTISAPQSGQDLNVMCTVNGVDSFKFCATQLTYCDSGCIAGIVIAVIVLLLILISIIFIILCCCFCDCCKGKKKTKPERFSNKGQELS